MQFYMLDSNKLIAAVNRIYYAIFCEDQEKYDYGKIFTL